MGTFVLVHGMLHGGWCWARTAGALEERGHRTASVDLPFTSYDDDVAATGRAIDQVTRETGGGPVVLVGHSYGGAVISGAATGRDDVAHLVYMAAILLDGSSTPGAMSGEGPATDRGEIGERIDIGDDGYITMTPENAIATFYNCCLPADAAQAAARLRPTSFACLTQASGGEPWRSIPTTYVLCEQDRAIPPDLQARMATRAGTVVRLDTDHSPFLSMVGPTVELLHRIGADQMAR